MHVAGGAIADTSLYIGTTSSYNGSTFEIRKNGIWDGPCITLYQTGTGGQAWSIFSTNSSFSQGAGKLLFYNGTGAGDVAVLDSSGNMGIGIMTPSARLHTRVNTASDDTAAIIEGTGVLGSGLHIKASGTSGDTWRVISTGTSSTPGAGSLGFYSTNAGAYRAVFSSANTFVFGDTDVPFAPAWPGAGVFGASGGDKVILGRLVSSYTGAVVAGHNDALSAWATLNLDGNGNIIFRESEAEKMRLQSGNLGIGTSSPGQRLQVNGTILANPGTSGTEYRDIMVGGINGWSNQEAHGIEAVYGAASSPTTFARFDMHYESSTGAGSFRWGKLFKSAGGSGYVMTLTATSTTTADLRVYGKITADNVYVGALTGWAGGRLQVGTTSTSNPAAEFNGTGNSAGLAPVYIWNNAESGNTYFINFYTDGQNNARAYRGDIRYRRNTDTVEIASTSDYRIKTIHGPYTKSGEVFDKIQVHDGTKHEATMGHIPMVVAHELAEAVPYAVEGEKDAVNEDGTPKLQMVSYNAMIPLMLAEIKSLRARVAELEAR